MLNLGSSTSCILGEEKRFVGLFENSMDFFSMKSLHEDMYSLSHHIGRLQREDRWFVQIVQTHNCGSNPALLDTHDNISLAIRHMTRELL